MQSLPDYLQTCLDLVFVGFNPSQRSAALGHYYAGRGNVFWPLLHECGLLPEALTFAEDNRLLEFGIGLTDLVKRPSRSSSDLARTETRAGSEILTKKILTFAPRVVCFNGKGVYAWYANRSKGVTLGVQDEVLGTTHVFVIPSNSGRNGRFTRGEKAAYFSSLRQFVTQHA